MPDQDLGVKEINMVDVLQSALSNAISWMKINVSSYKLIFMFEW